LEVFGYGGPMASEHASDLTVSGHEASPGRSGVSVTAAKATECEEWARENPDDPEAADALLDAAGVWAAAGDHERALALYREVQNGDWDRFGVAGAYIAGELFALGREGEARAAVTDLRVALDAAVEPDGDGYAAMADLLADRGQTEEALGWCEAGIARYCPHYRPDTALGDSYDATSAHLMSGRRMLREQLDLPADELDRAVDVAGERVLRLLDKFAAAVKDRSADRPRQQQVSGALSLYWSEPDFVAVRTRWPTIATDYGEDYRTYCLRVERSTRALSEQGHLPVLLVRDSLEGYQRYAQRVGQDPGDVVTREEYGRWRAGEDPGESVAWPPARNDRCWCGSGTKYKRCCGSAAAR
jgi:hypothetical protein